MPFYEVSIEGQPKRLIKAKSEKAAIDFVISGKIETRVIKTVEEAVDLFEAGVKVEHAETVPAQPEKGGKADA